MSGKSLDDYSDSERTAYEQGVADTHARYEAMQSQMSERLTRMIELVAKWETHSVVMRSSGYARELRAAIGLDSTPIACSCADCTKT